MDIGLVLGWLIAFITAASTVGVTVATLYQASVKRVIDAILLLIYPVSDLNDLTPIQKQIRSAIIVIGVFIAAAWVVIEGNINLFADSPFPAFAEIRRSFLVAANIGVVTVFSILGYEVSSALIARLQRVKEAVNLLAGSTETTVATPAATVTVSTQQAEGSVPAQDDELSLLSTPAAEIAKRDQTIAQLAAQLQAQNMPVAPPFQPVGGIDESAKG